MSEESAGSALRGYHGAWCGPDIDLLAFFGWTARLGPCAWSGRNAVDLVQCFARRLETRGCGLRGR
jgi:hypothetical protein